MANLATITALLGAGDSVIEDRLNHASLLDGGLFSGARFARYAHNDAQQAQRKLQQASGNKLLVADAVFSMDGDLACLPELARVAQQEQAWLMADDAHGLGTLGASGAGCVEHFALNEQQLPVLVGTLGKALGTAGAFVAGSEALIETLIQFARPYIYTTSQPPAVAWATLRSVQLAQTEHWRREHLQQLIQRFRTEALALGLPLLDSVTAIQPLLLGSSERALRLAALLKARGILVGAIRPPTVPAGSARLRITFSAAHTEQQLDRLLDALAESWRLLEAEHV
jgi:8-amino-7-oxononanoate synthase